ncbi:SagB/ThcOx family dehydrogenase [Sulfurospirillum arcachonense]|uniref:SagB/ThcOx family dehydrogenase n=1 Tax=Sulfurospirillum arcachonense TaxID=57666 RepID=UPI0004B87EF0|nr:SagB/ThcOx family dehydrogenase [Sulfurospirillum arcachonense]
MNKNIQTVIDYHERTKHSSKRYAKSLGYMDWANQPDPYRSYKNALHVKLPIALENITPPYHTLFEDALPSAPLLIDSISQFLQFSMGLAAIKSNGVDEWALRCNASSGNLHPSESYLILPPIRHISHQTTICHYAPQNHSLEILCDFDSKIWETLPKDSFFVALSSIVYREVWKYGERAFRYTNLDAGHALRSLQISAKTLGWHYKYLSKTSEEALSNLFGFNQKERFGESEVPDMFLLITPKKYTDAVDISPLIPNTFNSSANNIAQTYQDWPLIEEIQEATFTCKKNEYMPATKILFKKEPTKEAKEVILKRRSAQMMDKKDNKISFEKFKILLDCTKESFTGFENQINLVIFVHNVEDLKPGLYIFFRNEKYKNELQSLMHENFLWQKISENFYALTFGDFKNISKNISCNQSIASDGAFSLGMLSPFAKEIVQHGAQRYKELYWECGAIGQQLYLEATSLNYQATGIGCYLDDVFHTILGLQSNQFQSLYHFTVGKALLDSRILTKKVYQER